MSKQFDKKIRRQIRSHMAQATDLFQLGCSDESGSHWIIDDSSVASGERGISTKLWPFIAAEAMDDHGEINLPLTQARSLLASAAGQLAGIGSVTTHASADVRRSSIAPLARACVERSATVAWAMDSESQEQRILRALIVEIRGIDELLRYMGKARKDSDDSDLTRARTTLLSIAEERFGEAESDRFGRVAAIDGERLPSLTKRVESVTGSASYAELSAEAHPTGHYFVVESDYAPAGYGVAGFHLRSNIHEEGRLVEPAVQSFVRATTLVGAYIGAQTCHLSRWEHHLYALWKAWCTENGCP